MSWLEKVRKTYVKKFTEQKPQVNDITIRTSSDALLILINGNTKFVKSNRRRKFVYGSWCHKTSTNELVFFM